MTKQENITTQHSYFHHNVLLGISYWNNLPWCISVDIWYKVIAWYPSRDLCLCPFFLKEKQYFNPSDLQSQEKTTLEILWVSIFIESRLCAEERLVRILLQQGTVPVAQFLLVPLLVHHERFPRQNQELPGGLIIVGLNLFWQQNIYKF